MGETKVRNLDDFNAELEFMKIIEMKQENFDKIFKVVKVEETDNLPSLEDE